VVASDGALLSDPPSGGVIALENWNGDDVAHSTYSDGTLGTDVPVAIHGRWDGTQLTVTAVSTAPADWSASFPIERSATCSGSDQLEPFYALDHKMLGIRYWSEVDKSSNRCSIVANVFWLSPAVLDAVEPIGDRIELVPIVARTSSTADDSGEVEGLARHGNETP
jgi:hypothetical protein